jgi:hypothetical protein
LVDHFLVTAVFLRPCRKHTPRLVPRHRRRYIWIPSSQPTLVSRKVLYNPGLAWWLARSGRLLLQPSRSLPGLPGLLAPPNQQASSPKPGLAGGRANLICLPSSTQRIPSQVHYFDAASPKRATARGNCLLCLPQSARSSEIILQHRITPGILLKGARH